jgi:hypothetical protein
MHRTLEMNAGAGSERQTAVCPGTFDLAGSLLYEVYPGGTRATTTLPGCERSIGFRHRWCDANENHPESRLLSIAAK